MNKLTISKNEYEYLGRENFPRKLIWKTKMTFMDLYKKMLAGHRCSGAKGE